MLTIEERVAGLINASGLSSQQFTRWAGIDEARLMNALAGKRRFSSLDLALIADFSRFTGRGSHVSVEWLITGTQPPRWIRRSQHIWWRIRRARRQLGRVLH